MQPATKQTLATAFWAIGIDSKEFFKIEKLKDCLDFAEPSLIDIDQQVIMPGDVNKLTKVSLTGAGKIYLTWLKEEKHREELKEQSF